MMNATVGAKIRGTLFSRFGHDFLFAILAWHRLYMKALMAVGIPGRIRFANSEQRSAEESFSIRLN
jgi:hypothetical protein